MALYESVFLVRQDISNAQVDQLADQFSEIITNMGGTIAKREYWGVRKLAYRVKKESQGALRSFSTSTRRATRCSRWSVTCASTRTSCAI